ncbi:hypothetical protein ACQ4PT_002892 [Festuca glaucescens]
MGGVVVIQDDDPVVELAVREAEEGTVREREPREKRWQPRLHARRGAPQATNGTESDAAGMGWYAQEHEAQKLRREILPWSTSAAETRWRHRDYDLALKHPLYIRSVASTASPQANQIVIMGMIFETTTKRAAAAHALSEAKQVDNVEAAPGLRETTKAFLQRFPEAAALSPPELEAAVDKIIVQATPETASTAAPGKTTTNIFNLLFDAHGHISDKNYPGKTVMKNSDVAPEIVSSLENFDYTIWKKMVTKENLQQEKGGKLS